MHRDAPRLTIAAMAIGVAIMAASLPEKWVEELLGVGPDGGNGLVELLIVILPMAVGVTLAAPAIVRALSRWLFLGRASKNA